MKKSFNKDRLLKLVDKLHSSIESRVRSIESRVEDRLRRISKRIEERLGKRGAAVDEITAPDTGFEDEALSQFIHAKVDLYEGVKLQQVDEWYDELFDISGHFTGENLVYPTFFCESLEEFFEPHVRHLALSRSRKQQLIDYMAREAEELAKQGRGGIYGVNWPGDGCYLNGWLFAYPNIRSVAEVLDDYSKMPSIVSVVAHEKLGHGFLSEFTTLGKEREKIQLSRYKIADQFDIRLSDSPTEILLREKWEILFISSMYVEEGYATWVENKMLEALTGKPQKPYYSGAVLKLLDLMVRSAEDKELLDFLKEVQESVKILLEPNEKGPKELHAASVVLEQAEPILTKPFSRTFGQPARYVLGYLLFERLEKHFGTQILPYVVAAVYNVDYDLEKIANTDLARIVQREPRMNVHTRALQMLTLPKSAGSSVDRLFQASKELLSFAVPANINP